MKLGHCIALVLSSCVAGCVAAQPTDDVVQSTAGQDEQALGTTSTPGVAEWNTLLSVGGTAHRIVPLDLATDSQGNVWVAYADIYQTTYGGYTQDSGLGKFNPSGGGVYQRWIRTAQSVNEEHVAVASDGSVWFSTQPVGVDHIDVGCGVQYGVTGPQRWTFIAHFDANGTCLSQHAYDSISVHDLVPMPDGGIALYGHVWDNFAAFGDNVVVSSPDDVWALYVAVLDGNYKAKWARGFFDPDSPNGEREWESPGQIGVDASGNLIFSGTFFGKLTFGNKTYDSQRHYRGFLAKYSPQGNAIWSHPFGDRIQDTDMPLLSVSHDGHLAVAGNFRGTINFGNLSLYNGSSSSDVYVARLDANASAIWARRVWGSANMMPWGVALDGLGNVDLAMQFGGGTAHAGGFSFTADSRTRILLSKTSPTYGSVIWAKQYVDVGGSTFPTTLTTAPSNRILLGGEMEGGVDFGKGTLYPQGMANGFLVQFFQ